MGERMSPGPARKSTAVLAVDTGGTFTDLLLLEGNSLTALKVPSTPHDPAEAVLGGLRAIFGGRVPGGHLLIHGSTVATNALLERKGARVHLVTNAGFEDVIEIGRQDRPQLYALSGHRPPPLVARDDRIGIGGRIGPEGEELSPVDPAELAALAERLREAEAVAVALLHSYANPAHEEAVAAALSELAVPLSLSSRILPEFREFERTSTTAANAFVSPLVGRYLSRLAEGEGRRVRIMGSAGGALPLSRAVAEPVHTVLSGPAGGVVAALEWGRRCGAEHVLSFDMGGTSTDVSLIPGELLHTREGEVGGVPIAIPLLDIHTVGAGGGSIARVDPGGVLRVGPESAGAVPGPVAYGRGGREVTVTDAHVWLGRLPEGALLGGELALDRGGVAGPLAALAEWVGLEPDAAAEGVLEVVNAAMERALRVISVERGVDPADFHLVAFGGAAGLHAAEMVERLGLKGALIPPAPGLLSAFGMLVAPVVRDRSRTVLVSSAHPGHERRIRDELDDLEHAARSDMIEEGVAPERLAVTRWVDARYHGQSWELRVPAERWIERFHEAHEIRHGYRRSGVAVEAVTLRVRAEAPGEEAPAPEPRAVRRPPGESARVGWRGGKVEARIVVRSDLAPGEPVAGPAVILEYSATTWCPPGWSAVVGPHGVLRLGR